ncbi:penicillin acylase family protein [Salarchaeum japonicum]|uniref:Penicillin acylase family protein n=1 Tax=Salarchaeum japonicum TaxID=555573 RepID=A0AAV3T398_9EURY|nr:penicillin acylase family protein [Salarchaeum japonicum]
MDSELTRRGLVAAIVGGGAAAGAMSPVSSYLRRFAPFSGRAWADAADRTNDRVRSPYGPATVAYDDEYGVPTIEADDERALYFATGYVHGANRLFQLDLQRRQMRGQLSEVVGEATLDSDEFHRRMDFARAADATWAELAGSETTALVEAYADGVNACIEREPLPVEFGLLEYEPAPWTPADTVLMEKQIAWQLTGSFETLRNAAAADALGAETANALYPARLEHDAPILRGDDGGRPETIRESVRTPRGDARGLAGWLSGFESPPGVGSNSWVVSGDLTESGRPLVANDPHLSLMAPPVWFEQTLDAPDYTVRGVTFPGVPFVVIGENDHGAWGFTNVGADVLDVYEYETRNGEYRYRGEWEAFETEEVTIPVANAPDRTITRRTTRHGPYLEREGYSVAVAWTGLTATRTTDAIYDFNRSTGLSDVLAATELFDEPTQNLVYADTEGNTLYYATGQIPIRTIDGEEVRGDAIFDGSAGEGEWDGFEPYGTTDWSRGFVPFDEKPGVVNPDYVGTANQRVTDTPAHYLAESYSDPYRGIRIYDRLDERVQSAEPVTFEFMQGLHDDAYDGRVEGLVGPLADAIAGDYPGYASALREWDGHMNRDSTAALAFALFFDEYKRELFESRFDAAGVDADYYPRDWVVQHLDPDGEWFAERSRRAVMRSAFDAAVETIDAEGYGTYGDYNTTEAITHPFGQEFLNYPEYPTDGSRATVNNYAVERPTGSSWRMVCEPGGRSVCVIPGGNDGEVWSEHYSDQLRLWADTEYKPFPVAPGETAIQFVEGER